MHEKRLLERLRDIEQTPAHRGATTPGEAVNSILHHIGKILNTRQGSAPISPDYGIPDFTDLATSFGPDSIPKIEESLKSIICKYEPRLADVKIKFIPRPDLHSIICFKVEGWIYLGETTLPVVFETMLTAEGHLKLCK